MYTILIIDDEKAIRRTLKEILEYENFIVEEAADGFEAVQKLNSNNDFNLVLCDIKMPKMDGIEVLAAVKNGSLNTKNTNVPFIMISGHGDIETAVECMKQGAADYIEKPLDLNKLITTVNRVLKDIKTVNKYGIVQDIKKTLNSKSSSISKTKIIGSSTAITMMKNLIVKIAPTDARVLISGENGTGKELVAKMLYENSNRKDKPFVEINCAAIPNELIESELFGHVKGSFTSAIKDRKGKFEQADGGTLFLDEVGDMNLSAQSKVLRALQEKRICRVGSEKEITVDVRIIAATNKDLQKEIENGKFREDLYHRLCVIEIKVPSLNDRKEDIPLLIEYFLEEFAAENGKKPQKIESKAVEVITKMNFSGNVRQLRNIIERLTILSEDKITLNDVKNYVL
ncbi:MAG: sigma-54 dependent transcriptional regulator [Bacteroidales bacterium]|jgi:DNA-binding NtrC family response regulator|nr:sigma-54 dependent transcriptional regulator [Bacteroidales bacterium]